MAYRGGGGSRRRGRSGGHQYKGYGSGGRGGGGRAPTGFAWPAPGASNQHGVVFRGAAPTPPSLASSAPFTIRAPTAAPFQPAPPPTPAPASSPSTASVGKELEQKHFVSKTAPAAAAVLAASKEAAPDVDLAPVSKKGLAHAARPGVGTIGKMVMIRANHFLVDVADNNFVHYEVSINPESKSRATNREVLSELIKLHGKKSLGGELPAYDGRKSLYTAGSLPFESEEFVVTLVDPEKKDKERAEREYKITIRIAGRTDLFHLQQFLAGRQRDMPQETIQVLDVVLRESPSWNYVTVSRSFFSTTFGHRGDIGEGLECWRGYYQSLRPTQMGLSVNIDISATSFFKPVTVIQSVQEFLNLRDVSRPLTDRDRVKIKKALRGVRVETNHQQDQIRRYKITGITPIPMSQLIFPVDERGTRMTVVQYFMQRYNYRQQYTSWPCLLSGSYSPPVYLPMEACKIIEGQRYSKKLNDKQETNILRATCQRPQQREQSIREMVLHNKYAEDKFAHKFGIKVCSDLVSMPARVLPPPMLRYHDSGREKTCAPSVGQRNMINKKMINGGTIDKWACISFSPMRPEEVHRFCCDLVQMCNATGMAFCPRPLLDIRTATPNNIENALRDLNRRTSEMIVQQEKGKQLQLLIVILPEASGSYGKIKKVCETDLGIVSQCCLPRHASRPNKKYLENVALKINVKSGARNTVLERAFVRNGITFVSEVPTIIFAAVAAPDVNLAPVSKKGLAHPVRPVAGTIGKKVMIRANHFLVDVADNNLIHYDVGGIVQSHECGFSDTCSSRQAAVSRQALVKCDEDMIRVTIEFPHKTISLDVKKADCMRSVLSDLDGPVFWDSYYTYEGKILERDSIFSESNISNGSKIVVKPRLRGGADQAGPSHGLRIPQVMGVPLTAHIRELGKKGKWFESVEIPKELLCFPDRELYVVMLGEDGRITLLLILECLERAHQRGKCYRGLFEQKDMFFVGRYGVVEIDAPEYELDAFGYKKDNLKIRDIISKYFQYKAKGSFQYPMHVQTLSRLLMTSGVEPGFFMDAAKRSLVHNSAATMTPERRVQIITALMRYEKTLYADRKKGFEAALNCNLVDYSRALDRVDASSSWTSNVQNTGTATVLINRLYHSKQYTNELSSLLDFCRCVYEHGPKEGVTEKQCEAALYMLKPGFFPHIHRQFLTIYKENVEPDVEAAQHTSAAPSQQPMGGQGRPAPVKTAAVEVPSIKIVNKNSVAGIFDKK